MSELNGNSTSFTEKYRPKKPTGLFGKVQKDLAESLLKRVEERKFPKEVLFCGPTGVGKTTIAKMYAAKILGLDEVTRNDITEVNCGNDTGIDGIRAIIDNLYRGSLGYDYSIFYLDEIHRLTTQAQEALLTEIEPVPSHVVLLASTTTPEKIVPTLKGRFKVYSLPIPPKDEFIRLGNIVYKLNKKNPDLDIITQLYDECKGSVRVFQQNLQEVLEGTYIPTKLNVENENSIFYLLFYKNVKLQSLFESISDEKNYYGIGIGLCNQAIKILSNPKSQGEPFRRAQIVLQIMGEPWVGMDEKIVFHQRLLKIYVELSGK